MMALRIMMEYKTLPLGCDINILKFLVFLKFKPCIFSPFNSFLIKQKHLNSTL